jgi:dGTPase
VVKTYAANPNKSRGRLHLNKDCNPKENFQHDRDKILLSTSFRRLEYKTQVFANHEGDHYRTRLTHSLEVSQIARTISRVLGVCEELSETLALAHDLGHPPFGHAGEDALGEAMKEFGGFDHNLHTIKILTELEHYYVDFNGLNMSFETLEGIIKHNGPIMGAYSNKDHSLMIDAIGKIFPEFDFELDKFASIEAQIASLSDDIAYNNHDLEDGLRAELFKIDDLLELPIVGNIFKTIIKQYPKIEKHRLITESKRRLTQIMIKDLTSTTMRNIKNNHIKTADDIRNLGFAIVNFSSELLAVNLELKNFLYENMYRHYKINRMTSKARRVIKKLFELYFNEPECLPNEWRLLAGGARSEKTAKIVSDFIAGMTDRYAIKEYETLYGAI